MAASERAARALVKLAVAVTVSGASSELEVSASISAFARVCISGKVDCGWWPMLLDEEAGSEGMRPSPSNLLWIAFGACRRVTVAGMASVGSGLRGTCHLLAVFPFFCSLSTPSLDVAVLMSTIPVAVFEVSVDGGDRSLPAALFGLDMIDSGISSLWTPFALGVTCITSGDEATAMPLALSIPASVVDSLRLRLLCAPLIVVLELCSDFLFFVEAGEFPLVGSPCTSLLGSA